MKLPRDTQPSGRRRAGAPPPGRRGPNLWHLLRPRSSRGLLLGVLMAVGGLVGGVGGLLAGETNWATLGTLGIGVLGLLITVSWGVTYAQER
ncbi:MULTISPECIES: hypothetical protein [Streptomyces]|uniref:hypothetical protein n=1 Tax=Streptomyces TaxID=1883 RepID=UPI0002419FDA|nr:MULTISPECIES: hypothetical protein [Streptomyces]EHM29835.1 hypothetical protein SPW_1759 [Streptomyces sp. W007]MCX4487726.1 hypothetical protein [Streptomyces anulatus]MCX4522156.1 hypothetical protein [Streptomyces anulatus]WSR79292.1 hypothetical protein OG274_30350 [Streptomyces anulatus]WSU77150.1 hypothetical protein OG499_31215 [Streptomyces anulatus]